MNELETIIKFLSQHGSALVVFIFAVLLFADKIFDVTSKLNNKFGFETHASLEKKHQKEVIEQQRLMIEMCIRDRLRGLTSRGWLLLVG